MKKLLCLILLILCFAVPACAESVIPADDDDVKIMLEEAFSAMGLDYCNVILNREMGMFVIDIAIDGLTENLLTLKSLGFNENYEPWVETKEVFMSMFDSVLEMFKTVHRDDLRLIINVVNDDAYIREDYSTIRYSPLLSIGTFRMFVYDVMDENY